MLWYLLFIAFYIQTVYYERNTRTVWLCSHKKGIKMEQRDKMKMILKLFSYRYKNTNSI